MRRTFVPKGSPVSGSLPPARRRNSAPSWTSASSMRSSRRTSRIWRMAATDARVEKASRIRYEARMRARALRVNTLDERQRRSSLAAVGVSGGVEVGSGETCVPPGTSVLAVVVVISASLRPLCPVIGLRPSSSSVVARRASGGPRPRRASWRRKPPGSANLGVALRASLRGSSHGCREPAGGPARRQPARGATADGGAPSGAGARDATLSCSAGVGRVGALGGGALVVLFGPELDRGDRRRGRSGEHPGREQGAEEDEAGDAGEDEALRAHAGSESPRSVGMP